MNSIFELSAEYQRVMSEIMDSDEISNELMASMEAINDSLDNKVLNYTSMIKSIKAKSNSIIEAMDNMRKRAENLEKAAERLEESVKAEMQNCDKKKVENAYHEIQLIVNNPRVEYTDKTLVPHQYWRHKIKEILEPDTSSISKALKDGIEIPGAYLVRDTRLSIR